MIWKLDYFLEMMDVGCGYGYGMECVSSACLRAWLGEPERSSALRCARRRAELFRPLDMGMSGYIILTPIPLLLALCFKCLSTSIPATQTRAVPVPSVLANRALVPSSRDRLDHRFTPRRCLGNMSCADLSLFLQHVSAGMSGPRRGGEGNADSFARSRLGRCVLLPRPR